MIFAPIAPRPFPMITPIIPPIIHIITASTINCISITLFPAPNALRIPISFVLSVIETIIIFITPIPPTKSDIAATALIASLILLIILFVDSIIDSIL